VFVSICIVIASACEKLLCIILSLFLISVGREQGEEGQRREGETLNKLKPSSTFLPPQKKSQFASDVKTVGIVMGVMLPFTDN